MKARRQFYITKGKDQTGNLSGCWLLGGSLLLVHCKSLFFPSLLILACLMMRLSQFCTSLLPGDPFFGMSLTDQPKSRQRLLHVPSLFYTGADAGAEPPWRWRYHLLYDSVQGTPLDSLTYPIPVYGTSQASLKTHCWRENGMLGFLRGWKTAPGALTNCLKWAACSECLGSDFHSFTPSRSLGQVVNRRMNFVKGFSLCFSSDSKTWSPCIDYPNSTTNHYLY